MILPAHNRGDLNAAQWKRIAPLLPPQKPALGRPNNNHQTIINGILWVLRTGAPWRDVPDPMDPGLPVSGRFYRWRKQGIWQSLLQRLQLLQSCQGKSIGISISSMAVSFVLTNMLLAQEEES